MTRDTRADPIAERDARIARLERDLAAVQHTLKEYMTQREIAEDELRANEVRYRQMFEHNTAMKLLIDPADGRIVDANDAAAGFYGYDRDVLRSMRISDLNMLSPDQIAEEMARVREDARGFPVFPHRLASGEIRTVEVHSGPVLENGRALLYSIVHDITERVRAEEALQDSEHRYRAMIRRAPYGIYRATLDGRLIEANPAMIAILGYDSVEELLQIDLSRDLYVDAAERERVTSDVAKGRSVDWVDVRWRRKDGFAVTVRLSARPVPGPAGTPAYIEGIAENITELSRREALLRRSERMASLGNTLAGVAHELNNPLAAISGFSQLLLRGSWSEDNRSALEMINHEAGRAARVVKDLLTFARHDGAAQPLRRLDLNGVVRYIAGTQRYSLETRGIALEITLADDLPQVLGDAAQLEQVVLNLVVNARQAIESASDGSSADDDVPGQRFAIRLRTGVVHDHVVLEVADNGPGISGADLTRIWEPFWTTKPEGEGTGLGLAVVHGIVTSHGGSIDVESGGAGAGTCFTIILPPAPPLDAMRRVTPRTSGSVRVVGDTALLPLDILVVDDESSIVAFLTRCLGERGHAVVGAESGQVALRLAEQTAFDVVVCDLRMPGLGGADVVRTMRRMPMCAATRFIVSTGDSASDSTRVLLDALRPDAVVSKPYDIASLRTAIEGESSAG